MAKRIALLGSTGSIGCQTLAVAAQQPGQFQVRVLAAGHNMALLAEQVRQFAPLRVGVADAAAAGQLREFLASSGSPLPEIVVGSQDLCALAAEPENDLVVSAIVGAAGLPPTLAALQAGRNVALANKESLVMAGELVMALVRQKNLHLFPIDSEHSAIFQSLAGHRHEDVRQLWLTASGGPFREAGAAKLAQVTPAKALAHPNWSMGHKISIDSATLMNKGLEVIEAHWLFALPPEKIQVVVHPESIVHSMVAYVDGAVMAQLGWPDMRTPIAYALSYPERLAMDMPTLDFCSIGALHFSAPDGKRFPCLGLAYAALRAGGSVPAALNAANEEVVTAFLEERLSFMDIPAVVDEVLQRHQAIDLTDLETVLAVDHESRRLARQLCSRRIGQAVGGRA